MRRNGGMEPGESTEEAAKDTFLARKTTLE